MSRTTKCEDLYVLTADPCLTYKLQEALAHQIFKLLNLQCDTHLFIALYPSYNNPSLQLVLSLHHEPLKLN